MRTLAVGFLLVLALVADTAIAQTTEPSNFEVFQNDVERFLQKMHVKTPVTVKQSELWQGYESHIECEGAGDSVRCKLTVSETEVAKADTAFVEWMAAHESCHVELEHFRLDVMDFIQRGEEIERDADRCAYKLIGRETFVASILRRLYESPDGAAYKRVPKEILERSILRVYGDGQ